MAGLQSGEGRMMIDSVVLTQYINVTDTHTDSHVAIANSKDQLDGSFRSLKTHTPLLQSPTPEAEEPLAQTGLCLFRN